MFFGDVLFFYYLFIYLKGARKSQEPSSERINEEQSGCQEERQNFKQNNKKQPTIGLFVTNMDFEDDSLDDLLRDTSKLKKPAVNVVADELFTYSNPQQSSRREKKSALLAELFGPSSTTSFSAIESSLEDQGKAAEKFGSTHNLSTNSVEDKKTEEFSFGSYVPSSAARSGGTKSRPTSSGSISQQPNLYQPSSFNLEKRHAISDQLLPDGSPKQSIESSVKIPSTPDLRVSDSDWKSQLPPSSVPPSLLAKPNPKANVAQTAAIEQLPAAAGVLPFTFQLPTNQPVSKEVVDERNMAIIKEVLDNFSNNFCKKLDTLTGKNKNLSDISGSLVELHKCISTASQSWLNLNSANTVPDRAHGEHEKRMLILESKIEMMSQENTNLRARLELVENQMRENRNESSRIKTDTETVVESHLKWTREAVNNLDNKISSQSSQYKKEASEESNSREILLHQMQQKLLEFESKLVKSSASSGHQQEEALHLLKAEFKWLERQKKKLQNDKKELQALQKQIQGKQQLLDEFSAVVSKIQIG